MAYVGDCEDCEAGITQHSAEMIKPNSEKRKVKGSGLVEFLLSRDSHCL